ncbi:MAG: PepSY domain-containing protein, partial [Anaerotignum sp.]|nr:PepSY domain-containing protein [Anaerotignum sp.]
KPAGKDIGLEKAKKIALQHAGLKEREVSRLRAEKDFDDGRIKYDVEFQQGRMEYDYEIHAENGKILKAEKDFDD